MNEFVKQSIAFLEQTSSRFGSGNVVNDVVMLCVVGALISLVLALVFLRRSSGANDAPSMERVSSIGGRVEKLEMTLNEFRGETIRSLELFKGEPGYFKQELREIKRLLGRDEGGSGGTGGDDDDADDGGFQIPGQRKLGGSSMAAILADEEPVESSAATTKFEPAPISEAAPVPSQVETVEAEKSAEPKSGDLKGGLKRTRLGFLEKIKGLFVSQPSLDAELADELEALLVSSDLGIKLAGSLIESLKADIAAGKKLGEIEVRDSLKNKVQEILERSDSGGEIDPLKLRAQGSNDPQIILVVGINGVGKTTTVAKLAENFKSRGAKVMLAAADTFRAAAVEQLKEWGSRIDVPVVSGAPEAKPSTVVFDAVAQAKYEKVDVLIVDTAGRLHTKSNLMQELEGVRNAITRHIGNAPHETLLVVDGTSGQNALSQAREFNSAVPLTGVIVTKLDGTPKGGIVIAIKDELGIPIRYIGVGEGREDLKAFHPGEFVEAVFDLADPEKSGSSGKLSAHAEERKRREELGMTSVI